MSLHSLIERRRSWYHLRRLLNTGKWRYSLSSHYWASPDDTRLVDHLVVQTLGLKKLSVISVYYWRLLLGYCLVCV